MGQLRIHHGRVPGHMINAECVLAGGILPDSQYMIMGWATAVHDDGTNRPRRVPERGDK